MAQIQYTDIPDPIMIEITQLAPARTRDERLYAAFRQSLGDDAFPMIREDLMYYVRRWARQCRQMTEAEATEWAGRMIAQNT